MQRDSLLVLSAINRHYSDVNEEVNELSTVFERSALKSNWQGENSRTTCKNLSETGVSCVGCVNTQINKESRLVAYWRVFSLFHSQGLVLTVSKCVESSLHVNRTIGCRARLTSAPLILRQEVHSILMRITRLSPILCFDKSTNETCNQQDFLHTKMVFLFVNLDFIRIKYFSLATC